MNEKRRKDLSPIVRQQVLMEAGYKCGNPACRNVITLHIHHIVWVTDGGKDEAANLLALCPYCHSLHHAGQIPIEAIRHWKGILQALNHAFNKESMDLLLYLNTPTFENIWYSGDALLRFAGLVAAGLVVVNDTLFSVGLRYGENSPPTSPATTSVRVSLSDKGRMLVEAWIKGDEGLYRQALETKSQELA